MSTISIALVLLSSVIHAGWNLISKKDNSSISYFFVGNIAAGIVIKQFGCATTTIDELVDFIENNTKLLNNTEIGEYCYE